MLGSSPDSALLAGQLGLPYNFALFINNQMSPQIFDVYRSQFEASEQLEAPHTCLTVRVVCAETEAEARRLALSMGMLSLSFATGQTYRKVPSVAVAEAYPYSQQEAAFVNAKLYQAAIGNP